MKVIRTDLLTALNIIKPGLSSKKIVPQSDCAVFKDKAIIAYNDDVAVSVAFDFDFEGAVPWKLLFDLVSKMKSEAIDLSEKDGTLIVKGDGIGKIQYERDILIPIKSPESYANINDPVEFGKSLRLCLLAVSKDNKKPALHCVHLAKNRMESCDGERLVVCSLSQEFDMDVLLPFPAANIVSKFHYIEGIARDESWCYFSEIEGIHIACRVYNVPYISLDDKYVAEGTEVTFPKSLSDSLEKAILFSNRVEKGDNKVLEVNVREGWIFLVGKGSDGEFRSRDKIQYEGEPLRFLVNPEYFRDFLTVANRALVRKESVTFIGDNFVHYVCNIVE
jgi:hypothetical protein